MAKRRVELKNRYVEVEGNIIYSGECFFVFELTIVAVNNAFALFHTIEA